MSRHSPASAPLIQTLAEQVRAIEGARRPGPDEIVSSGHAALDQLLPGGGFCRGSLVEWLAGSAGSGAGTLALLAASQAALDGGAVVVLDQTRLFYPPAAAQLGLDLQRLILLRPAGMADQAWALDQVLRSRGVAAVWCALDKSLEPPGANPQNCWRRWQLAVEASGVLGLLLRPLAARRQPCWAEMRLLVEPRPQPEQAGRQRALRVELLRAPAVAAPQAVELELPAWNLKQPDFKQPTGWGDRSHETRPVHLAPSVAPAKTRRRGAS